MKIISTIIWLCLSGFLCQAQQAENDTIQLPMQVWTLTDGEALLKDSSYVRKWGIILNPEEVVIRKSKPTILTPLYQPRQTTSDQPQLKGKRDD